MAYFKGYTYNNRTEAVMNSMHFELTCYFDPHAKHPRDADCRGIGNWRYFYRGEEIPYSPDLYTTENNLHWGAPESDPTLDEDYEERAVTSDEKFDEQRVTVNDSFEESHSQQESTKNRVRPV